MVANFGSRASFSPVTNFCMRCLLAFLLGLVVCALPARAAEPVLPEYGTPLSEPFFKQGDVIALVGGEDMVVANELGSLETDLQKGFPQLHLKVRSLAWEGDTVFEQHRDLNYPALETQLDKIGATVVVCWFGQMESLRGSEKVDEFLAAYRALLARLSGGGKRRFLILTPPVLSGTGGNDGNKNLVLYAEKIAAMEKAPGMQIYKNEGSARFRYFRDGVHLNKSRQEIVASRLAYFVGVCSEFVPFAEMPSDEALHAKVLEKNRLWFEYTRPQNWAFLAGDRTNQPSSRDYKDPSKRWFPVEMEEFVPLIEKKDAEIWEAAGRLGGKK